MVDFELTQYRFPNESILFMAPTYDQMRQITHDVYTGLSEIHQRAPINLLVTIPNGALSFVAPISRGLELSRKIAIVGAGSFTDIGEGGEVVITSPLSDQDIEGQTVCLVDEVCDRGKTLAVVQNHISDFRPRKIVTAAHILKQGATFQPDIVGMMIKNEWVIFPDDLADTVRGLSRRWRQHDPEEVRHRLGVLFHEDANPTITKELNDHWLKTQDKLNREAFHVA